MSKREQQIKCMTSIINQLCDIIEEKDDEIHHLKLAVENTAAHVHGLNQELDVYIRHCQSSMREEDFQDLWKKGRLEFRAGKDKWSTDEHQRTD